MSRDYIVLCSLEMVGYYERVAVTVFALGTCEPIGIGLLVDTWTLLASYCREWETFSFQDNITIPHESTISFHLAGLSSTPHEDKSGVCNDIRSEWDLQTYDLQTYASSWESRRYNLGVIFLWVQHPFAREFCHDGPEQVYRYAESIESPDLKCDVWISLLLGVYRYALYIHISKKRDENLLKDRHGFFMNHESAQESRPLAMALAVHALLLHCATPRV